MSVLDFSAGSTGIDLAGVAPSTTPGLAELAAQLSGRLSGPLDDDYDTLRQAWNLAVDQRPLAVVQVADAQDVAAVVRFARANGVTVAPQGTGHNAAPLGDLANSVLVRTDRLRQVLVDAATRTVRVGAGVLWGEVTTALAPHGLTALAGSSSDVGVVGYSLGGGFSWLSRKHGLAASAVTAVELVTGDGEFRRVDAQHDAELFWAVRGGGGNFGVVTALEFEVLPLEFVYAGMMLFPLERATEVLHAYRTWSTDLDEAATTCIRLLRVPPLPELPEMVRGKSFVAVDGAIEAPLGRASDMIGPLRALGPVLDTFGCLPTANLATLHMDPPHPVPGAGDGMIISELTEDTVDALVAVAGPESDCRLLTIDLRQVGGALGRPDPRGGAVDHLPGAFLVFAVGMAPTPELGAVMHHQVAAVRNALTPWAAERDYGNFREAQVSASRFYAADTLDRLFAVQDAVDPDRVIRSNHPLR